MANSERNIPVYFPPFQMSYQMSELFIV